jgi:hypothetical protein
METITVKNGRYQKWQKILLFMQNKPHEAFIIKFTDVKDARIAMMRLKRSMDYNPSWYNLDMFQRGCNIYVIKPDKAQKVVIQDG